MPLLPLLFVPVPCSCKCNSEVLEATPATASCYDNIDHDKSLWDDYLITWQCDSACSLHKPPRGYVSQGPGSVQTVFHMMCCCEPFQSLVGSDRCTRLAGVWPRRKAKAQLRSCRAWRSKALLADEKTKVRERQWATMERPDPLLPLSPEPKTASCLMRRWFLLCTISRTGSGLKEGASG